MDNIVLVSGGIDSAVTLGLANQHGDTAALHVNYGQHTQSKESNYSEKLANHYGNEYIEIDLTSAFHAFQDGLTNEDVDLSTHYDEQGVATSYIPMRNTIFLSIAAGVAEKRDTRDIWYGPNLQDREGYADCRYEYIDAVEEALSLGTDRQRFNIHAPLVELEKHEIIQRGLEIGVPFEYTWSCYQAEDAPCMECASCKERRNGFREIGVSDPIDVYQ